MNVLRLVLIVSVMGWFLSRFELIGAVMVTVLGVLFVKTVAIIRIKTLVRAKFAELLPWRQLGGILFAASAGIAPVALMNRELMLAPVLRLPVSAAVYVTTYAVLLLLLGIPSPSERHTVFGWLTRQSARTKPCVE
jgi:hypothetical protein